MINSKNSYDELKHVIVGKELNLNKRIIDFTFKHFYSTNLNQSVYEQSEYFINSDILERRIEQLDGLANTLTNLGIVVSRPDDVNKIHKIQTPSFTSEHSSASNVRDMSMVFHDKIIETPTYVLNRYFENLSLYKIYNKVFDNGKGGQWIRCPHTELTEDSIDLRDWKVEKDYSKIPDNYVMAIDGAQFLRLDNECIVNISSYNHYLGYKWIQSFYPDVTFYPVTVVDNHIDGALISLDPETFLISPKYKETIMNQLPDKFKKFKYVIPEEFQVREQKNKTNLDIQLCSSLGMDINVLSVNHNTILVNKEAIGTIKALERNNFNVVPIQLENCEIFGGGIHCSTLDIERE